VLQLSLDGTLRIEHYGAVQKTLRYSDIGLPMHHLASSSRETRFGRGYAGKCKEEPRAQRHTLGGKGIT